MTEIRFPGVIRFGALETGFFRSEVSGTDEDFRYFAVRSRSHPMTLAAAMQPTTQSRK